MRYFIELVYNGKNYHGWQKQPKAVSVQEVVEKAISVLVKQEIELVGAGRTDAGVHARQLFAHFDISEAINEEELVFRLNSFLPQDIAVKEIFKVKNDAHARFDAVSRAYEYWVVQEKNPFETESAYFVKQKLDLEAMNSAAEKLIGFNDFKCFSKSRTDVKTYNCTIEQAFWEQKEDKLVFHIKADRFLRNMVRAIVGTLLDVGTGKMEIFEIEKIIKSRDRSSAGTSVPAQGLYLTQVEYPQNIKGD